MIKITNCTIARSITINLGEYKSSKADVSLEFEVDPDVAFAPQFKEANETCLSMLSAVVEPVVMSLPIQSQTYWSNYFKVHKKG